MGEQDVLIAGANSDIGLVMARSFAERDAAVLMVSRDAGRGGPARVAIAKLAIGPALTLPVNSAKHETCPLSSNR